MLSAVAFGLLALASAQVPPSAVLLTAAKSGVIPVTPTPFSGVETLEGAIIDDGGIKPGFTGQYGNASVQQNAAGVTFQALLPATNFDNLTGSIITGYVNATVPSNGTGVMFTVHFDGVPSESEYGPFVYHIHGLPVPSDGNCTATLGHLDTTNRGEYYACDPSMPQTCQVGDLSGKHGNITSNPFDATYTDLYLSTRPDNSYYFGHGSIVIHSRNATRLTCANLTLISAGTANYNYSSSAINIGGAATTSGASVGSAATSAMTTGTTGTGVAATTSGAVSTVTTGTTTEGVSTGSMSTAATSTGAGTSASTSGAAVSAKSSGGAVPTGVVAGGVWGVAALLVGGLAMV